MKNSEKFDKITGWMLIVLSIISIVLIVILSIESRVDPSWGKRFSSVYIAVAAIISVIVVARLIKAITRKRGLKVYCQCKDCPNPEIKEGQSIFIADNKFYHSSNICGERALGGREDENLSLEEKEKRAHNVSIRYQDALKIAEEDIASGENKLKFRKPWKN